jgi:DNA-directed RNA polymerase specialized sigma24 family protein
MDLLQRFTHGETDAFETLVHQFQGDIYAWTVRIVRDQGVAEDLTVETLWRIYRARHQFRPDGNFGA